MIPRDVQEVLSRAVGTFIDPDGAFKEKLEKKARGEYDKDIVIKLGIDPTRPDIHLGHAVILRRLRQLQDFGCKVVFLVGDFTAHIGDPTGKSKVRPELEQVEIEKNVATYLAQVNKILKVEPEVFAWIRNSDWFYSVQDLVAPHIEMEIKDAEGINRKVKLEENSILAKAALFAKTRMQTQFRPEIESITLRGLLWTLKHITHATLIDRDMFQERIAKGEQLYMHEMLYPVLQGVDSFVIHKVFGSCDLEIGGTDQTFNMLMGRTVMKVNGLPEQAVMSLEILPGLDGKEKMSKSLDNYIAITDAPNDMYGKVMSVPDECLPVYFRLATYTPLEEIEKMEKDFKAGKGNPRDSKMRLARQIVAEYHGEEAAEKAEKNFVDTFSKGGIPTDIEIVRAAKGTKIVDILLSQGVVESKTEWRRLIDDGAVKNAETDSKLESADVEFEVPITLKVGKRRFIKLELL